MKISLNQNDCAPCELEAKLMKPYEGRFSIKLTNRQPRKKQLNLRSSYDFLYKCMYLKLALNILHFYRVGIKLDALVPS